MNKSIIRYLIKLLLQQKYYLLVLMAILTAILEFLLAYYLNAFVGLVNHVSFTHFIFVAFGLIVIGIMIGLFQKLIHFRETMMQLHLENEITNDIFKSSSYQSLDEEAIGAWVSLSNSDAPLVAQTISGSLTEVIMGLASFGAALIFGLLVSPRLTLIILVLGVVSLLIPKYTSKWILKTQSKRQTDQDTMQTTLLQIFNAKVLLFTLSAQKFAQQLFRKKYQNFTQSQLENAKVQYKIGSLSIGIGFLFDVSTLIISLYFVAKNQITLGEFMGFNVLNSSFTWIFYTMPELYGQILRGGVSLKRLLKFEPIKEPDKEDNLELADQLVLNQVSFKYDDSNKWTLKDINLNWSLSKSMKILLTGPSGSGKSTLLSLILGFQRPTNGQVYFINEKHHNIEPDKVQLSYVPQQVHLFSMTLRDNILLGRKISEKHYQKIIQDTNLDEFINSLPSGSETLIQSNNTGNLSSGQIQKIGLARALVTSTNFIMLDEPTANLDEGSANDFIDVLNSLQQSVLIITHRPMKQSNWSHYELKEERLIK